MSSDLYSPLTGAKQKAVTASVEARAEIIAAGDPPIMHRGKVTGSAAGGTWAVDVIDDATGAVIASYESVHGFPPGMDYVTGDFVLLMWLPPNPIPVILALGNSECGVGTHQGFKEDWGGSRVS